MPRETIDEAYQRGFSDGKEAGWTDPEHWIGHIFATVLGLIIIGVFLTATWLFIHWAAQQDAYIHMNGGIVCSN